MEYPIAKALLTLVAAIILLGGLLVVVKRFAALKSQTPLGSSMKLLSRLPLSPKHQIALVKIADKVLIVGIADNSLSLLGEISDPDEIRHLLEAAAKEQPALPLASLSDFLSKNISKRA